jgi:hypothetical protein
MAGIRALSYEEQSRPVTLHDIGFNKVWNRMTVRDAEADIRCARKLGDTLQEYDTADRSGQPLRVVLHICTSTSEDRRDLGGVYELPC